MLEIFFIGLYLILMTFIIIKQKSRFTLLKESTKGRLSFFGTLKFKYKSRNFYLYAVSTQSFETGFGGSYHRLLLRVNDKQEFFLGPESSYKYIAIGKLPIDYLSFQIENKINNRKYVLKAKSLNDSEELVKLINSNSDLKLQISLLFQKDFQYVRGLTRLDFEDFSIKRNLFIELSFVPHEALKDTEIFYKTIDNFLNILEQLRIISKK